MFVMLKLLKLFVRLVLLPFRLLLKVVGLVTSSVAFGSGSSSADFEASTEVAGGGVSETAAATSAGGSPTRDTGETGTASGVGSERLRPEPSSQGAVPALKWGGSLLADRPELLGPALGLGVFSLLVSLSVTAGDVGEAAVVALLLQSVLSVVVAGLVAVVAAGELRGNRYSLATAGRAVAEHIGTALGVTILLGLGSGLFVGLAVLVSPVLFLLGLPMLYVFLRLSFAIPAVFVDGSGLADAFGRSWSRTEGKGLTLFGIVLATGALSVLQVVPVVGPIAAPTVVTPLWAAALTSLYVAAAPVRPSVDGASTQAIGGEELASGTTEDAESVDSLTEASSDPASDAAAVEAETAVAADDAKPVAAATAETGSDSETSNEPDRDETTDAEDGEPDSPGDSGDAPPAAGASGGGDDETGETGESTADAPDAEDRFSGDDAERAAELREAAEAGDLSPDRVEDLVGLLDSDDSEVRLDAVVAFGEVAAAHSAVADDARGALRDCRLDPDGEVSRAASKAIAKIEAAA